MSACNKIVSIKINDKLPQSDAWSKNTITPADCPNIAHKYPQEALTVEKINDAADMLLAWMMYNKFHELAIDVDIRESFAETYEEEMTIEDLEHIVGHKIKIVGGK